MPDFSQVEQQVTKGLNDQQESIVNIDRQIKTMQKKGYDLLAKLNSRKKIPSQSDLEWVGKNATLGLEDFWLCQVDEITFVDKAPQKEGVENILGTFRGLVGFNFIYMIIGNQERIRFYLGVARDKSHKADNKDFTVDEIGECLLKPAIQGNFRGCKLSTVPRNKTGNLLGKEEILETLRDKYVRAGLMYGVPSTDRQNNRGIKEKENFQGTDRLVDVMQGSEFGVVIIAQPCAQQEVDQLQNKLYEAADLLVPITKYTLQRSQGTNTSYNDHVSTGTSNQYSSNVQVGDSENYSYGDGHNEDSRRDVSRQLSKSSNDTSTDSYSHSKSYSKSHEFGSGGKDREDINDTADANSNSIQKTTGGSYNFNVAQNSSTSKTENHQYVKNHSDTTTTGKAIMGNDQLTKVKSASQNACRNENMEVELKAAADWLKYIDEVLLPRVDNGKGKGIFNVCTYLFAETHVTFQRLANTAISLYSGPLGNKAALDAVFFNDNDDDCRHLLSNMQIPTYRTTEVCEPYEAVASKLVSNNRQGDKLLSCGSWMSSNELGLMAGFPQKEIVGLKLREEVEFGLNVAYVKPENCIHLGNLVQCGREIHEVPVSLDKTELDKHTFIAGVTGSGKTTTCQRILLDGDIPFMVIEPAKTEYRALSSHPKLQGSDIIYFTPGKQSIAPFFLNPFELFPGEEISSRADMLTATFEASFEMEAAIPQIMGTAIYRAYSDKGWNTAITKWKNKDGSGADNPFADGVYAFPTLSDFKDAVKSVIDSQGFDDRLRDEYLGSINARIESLMIGAKGQMLNTPRSVDFTDLVTRRVVIELEEIKSSSEKSLLMGLVMTNLMQAVKRKKAEQKDFHHITLIEEAHRLLSRYMPGDSRNQKQGVEVFADMLAEVRKYGECLIIVDQIPDKLTPEVLKNTNTKIVHKLFAKDDKDAIGNTMSLTDEQKNFLSNLQTGRAVVFSQGWDKAMQVQVAMSSNTGDNDIDEQEIHRRSLKYYASPHVSKRGVIPGSQFEAVDGELPYDVVDRLLCMHQQSYQWLNDLRSRILVILSGEAGGNERQLQQQHLLIASGIKEAEQNVGLDWLLGYIYLKLKDLVFDEESFQQVTEEYISGLVNQSDKTILADSTKNYLSNLLMHNVCRSM